MQFSLVHVLAGMSIFRILTLSRLRIGSGFFNELRWETTRIDMYGSFILRVPISSLETEMESKKMYFQKTFNSGVTGSNMIQLYFYVELFPREMSWNQIKTQIFFVSQYFSNFV